MTNHWKSNVEVKGCDPSQAGIGMISVMLGLALMGVASLTYLSHNLEKKKIDSGIEIAKRVDPVVVGVNRYISEMYSQLQSGLPINHKGHNLTVGDSAGQTMSPTISDLVSMEYLPTDFNSELYVNNSASDYIIKLDKVPAGCLPKDCEISGYLALSSPVINKNGEQEPLIIGSFRKTIGPDAIVSLNTNRESLISGHGFSFPNPINNNPPGVIGVALGHGTSEFGQYLTLNDSRDPNFRGELSVKDKIESETSVVAPLIIGNESVGAGTDTDSNGDECRLAELLSDGSIISRSVGCIKRVVIGPDRSTIKANRLDGSDSVIVNGADTSLQMMNSAQRTSIFMDGAESIIDMESFDARNRISLNSKDGRVLLGDRNVVNVELNNNGQVILANQGLETIKLDSSDQVGRVEGKVLSSSASFIPGVPCTAPNKENDIARNAQNAGLVVCSGGVWLSLTTNASASVGDSCTKDGSLGIGGNTETALICSGGKWVSLEDRIGRRVLMASYNAENNISIPKPSCLSGTTGSAVYLIPRGINSSQQALNYFATDQGSSWRISITDGAGVVTSGIAIAMTYCLYGG